MKLTLAIPSLNRCPDETPLPLALESFNQILRYGRLKKQAQRPSEFYSRHLWQGSLLEQAKRALDIAPQQPAAFASPLWQQMGMHRASVIGGGYLDIGNGEAEQFCSGLEGLYGGEGWRFYPLRPDMWLVTMPSESDWQVAPVLDVWSGIDAADQACGRDALQWLGKQTEIQMWLHAHPLNRDRQSRQLPAVNGLWLWQDVQGGQTAPLIASDSPWAQFFQGTRLAAPYDFAAYSEMTAGQGSPFSDGLVFLDDLVITGQTGDVHAYREILQSWETRWFAPLLQAVGSGRLKRLVIATDGGQGGELVLTPKSKWAFWKRGKRFEGIW